MQENGKWDSAFSETGTYGFRQLVTMWPRGGGWGGGENIHKPSWAATSILATALRDPAPKLSSECFLPWHKSAPPLSTAGEERVQTTD